ncbi:hypothetical protein F8S13_11645 [Chloroflexia bacterium SDU3-3]|nr:hypothetical protein F8S13_11645 [Chloroflexia bacterium SDU3-3]
MIDIDGLDPQALQIIGHRYEILTQFFTPITEAQLGGTPTQADSDALRQRLSTTAVSEAEYLALAQQLGFVDRVRQRLYLRLWRTQMLNPDRWPNYSRTPTEQRPRFLADITQHLASIHAAAPGSARTWAAQLIQQQISRDEHAAWHIASELDRIPWHASSQAREMLRMWAQFGDIGLLSSSEYPNTDELIQLEQLRPTIVQGQPEPQQLIGQILADIIAIYQTMHSPQVQQAYRKHYGEKRRAWNQSLLVQPPQSQERQKAQADIAPLKPIILPILAQQRQCSPAEADATLSAFLAGGIPAMSTLHGHLAQDSIAEQRIQQAALPLLRAVAPASRDIILARMLALHQAARQIDSYFPILKLITESFSSRFRRKQQHRDIPPGLAEAFAAQTQIKTSSTSLITNFTIYGPLGMLSKREWKAAIHPHLWSYLHLMKLGRLEGTLSEENVVTHVNRYATMLGIEPLPRLLAVGIYHHFPKPSYYNSGDGRGIAGVPLRKSLKLAGIMRLHEQWIVVPIKLMVSLVNTALHPMSKACTLLLVLDVSSQKPMGFWLSPHAPDGNDVGLALYDAIFHPQALGWPLRGIPEQILIPTSCAKNSAHIKHAATYLIAQLGTTDELPNILNRIPEAKQFIARLQEQYQSRKLTSHRYAPNRQMTIQQLEDELRATLIETCFPDHRIEPVIASLRAEGFALPGYDTPAAGWLLPVEVEHAVTIRDGVEFDQRFYTSTAIAIEPGIDTHIRCLPLRIKYREGIFIEYMTGVLYLTMSR